MEIWEGMTSNIMLLIGAGKTGFLLLLGIGIYCAVKMYGWMSKEDAQTKQRNKKMRLEMTDFYMRLMNYAYGTGNLTLLEQVYSKELYRQELATAERLRQFGLYKVIRITNPSKLYDNPFANMYDGKTDAGIVHLECDYQCDYVYRNTNTAVFTMRQPKASLVVNLLTSHYKRNQESFQCPNCGNPMIMKGDYVVCSYCSTQFSAESANWIIHGWSYKKQMDNQKNTTSVTALSYALVILGMCLMPLFVGVAAIAFVVFVIYSFRQIRRVRMWEKLQATDPNFSLNLLKTRIWNLVQTVGYVYREDVQKYQNLVTPAMEQQLHKMRENEKEDRQLLDLYITKCEPTNFKIQGKEQRAEFECVSDFIMLKQNRIYREHKKLKVTLTRPNDSITPVLLQESFLKCRSCGASMDVMDTKCPYCGNIGNISGWRLDKIKGL